MKGPTHIAHVYSVHTQERPRISRGRHVPHVEKSTTSQEVPIAGGTAQVQLFQKISEVRASICFFFAPFFFLFHQR